VSWDGRCRKGRAADRGVGLFSHGQVRPSLAAAKYARRIRNGRPVYSIQIRSFARTAVSPVSVGTRLQRQHGMDFSTLKFGRVPQGPQKRELVASRFTLQGHLSPHAGKSGPFLLHGG